jgi:iron(III) transport system ATP-binding protein
MTTHVTESDQAMRDMASREPAGAQASASLTGIRKTFVTKGKTVDAIKDVDLQISPGEYVVILGPSGCGKSTLIRCIAGLESPTAGKIDLQGRTVYDATRSIDMKANARNVGMVFQSYALWPHMTIEQNVAYPLKMRKVPRAEREKRVAEVLRALECEPLAKRLPAELSGGQQQRIALARALVYEPAILLLDEPLSNLDALLRVSLRTELLRLHRMLGYTALHITHDQEEALEMGDRVILMREGEIEQSGPPEEVYSRPVSPYAANFLGVRNRVKVTVRRGRLEYAGGAVPGSGPLCEGLAEGSELLLFVRGRDTRVLRESTPGGSPTSDSLQFQGTLTQVVLGEGGRRQFVVDIAGEYWFAQHAERAPDLSVGDKITVEFPLTSPLLYGDEKLVYPR